MTVFIIVAFFEVAAFWVGNFFVGGKNMDAVEKILDMIHGWVW